MRRWTDICADTDGKTRRLCVGLLLCATLTGCETIIDALYAPKEGVRPAQYKVSVERGVAMKTRDGVTLVADVHHPDTDERVPTILVRIPFSNTMGNRLRADAAARFWASRGYRVVIQGTRGRYKSSGNHYPLLPERDDGIDTLRWLTRQQWFDSRLGMWGGSAFGYTQWVLADQVDPGPKALAIQIASTSFYEMFYPGGAFSLESALFWAVRSRGAIDEDPVPERLEKGYAGFPLIEADDRAASDIPFFNDWATHNTADSYWRAIDGSDRARNLKAPVLLMAGWYDPFLPTQLRDFMTIRASAEPHVATQTRLVIGPWSHADTVALPGGVPLRDYRQSVLAPSIAWFDRHLLGVASQQREAPITIYVMGDNVWREEQEWPLARARVTPFYLSSNGNAARDKRDGRVSPTPPSAAQGGDSYVYDPRRPVPSRGGAMLGPRAGITSQNEIEARDDVLVYTSDELTADTEVTGPLRAVLYVSTSAKNTDFVVRLVDLHPDGSAYNVSDGILRQSYSDTRDQPQRIEIDLWPTSMVFKKGHRIRIDVTSSSYPRFDRNPNTGRDIATEAEPIPAEQTIHHGKNARSHVLLPVVPRSSN
jgi:putative CocE/NonD family hydrolase